MELNNISFQYHGETTGGVTFRQLNMSIRNQALHVLIGKNGSGKTSLLRLLTGLVAPTHGEVLYDGKDLHKISHHDRSQCISWLPQHLEVPFAYNVADVVWQGLTPWTDGLGHDNEDVADERRESFNRLCEELQVTPLLGRSILTLSGGERQRVFLARALLGRHHFLALDEPTTHLDIAQQLHVFRLLKQRATRQTVVISCHDIVQGLRFADVIHVLYENGDQTTQVKSIDKLTHESAAFLSKIFGVDMARGANGWQYI